MTTARNMLHRARVIAWGQPKETKEEERLLRKIDFAVLTFVCSMYWSNYLNRANFANAYVSGMREDLGFVGNQYNQVNVVFTCAYTLGQVPNNLILQVVPAHYWLPTMAMLWGALSGCTAAATKPWHVMLIRFFQAICESSTFSGTHWILGSWYTDEELGKRSAIFSSSAQLGTMFSGVLQGAILKGLPGRGGLSSWQWLFILDMIIAFPIAFYGFLFFPGTPKRTREKGPLSFTAAEREMASDRLPVRPHTTMDWSLVKRVVGRWHFYAFSLLFAVSSMLECVGSMGLMQLWLAKEPRVSPPNRNYYALAPVAVAIVGQYAASWYTDWTQNRWPVNVGMAVALIFTSSVLLAWPASFGFRFFAFTISGLGYMGQATNFVWCNVVIRNDDQERGVVLASMNMFSNVVQAFYNITAFPASSAPRFHGGWIGTIVMAVLTVIIGYATHLLHRRELRNEKSDGENDATSSQGEEGGEHEAKARDEKTADVTLT